MAHSVPITFQFCFEGPLLSGKMRRFPRTDIIDLASDRVLRSIKEEWLGAHVRLLPAQPRKRWYPKLRDRKRVLQWTADSDLFVDRCSGYPRRVPDKENVDWAAASMSRRAQGGTFCDGQVRNR